MEAERSVVTTCTTLFFAPYIIWLFIDELWVWMAPSQTSIQHTCKDCKSGEVWTFGGILLLLVPALLFLQLWPLLPALLLLFSALPPSSYLPPPPPPPSTNWKSLYMTSPPPPSISPSLLPRSLLSSLAAKLLRNYRTMSFLSHGQFWITYLALPAGLLKTRGVMVTAWLALHS